MKIKISRIDKTLPLPKYQTAGSVAFDLYSRIDKEIPARSIDKVPSNLIIEVPAGFALIIANRSSLTAKKGLTMSNNIGIIDQDFCGSEDEINLSLYNITDEPVKIKRGERLCQALLAPVEKVDFEEVEKISDKSRGGFGSTGDS
ncbi:MAG TPA: dUTP diphosphatase [Candidatus Bipolaricaulota bacterium]|nr:dUTP diphosphatase [Candidatus Bipolaricaulota bacterium]